MIFYNCTLFSVSGIIVTSALMMWKTLICITGSISPIVVVLSESMEPGFQRGRDIPIVHRVIKVHERKDNGEVDVLTKGDNNLDNDISLYAPGQHWLRQEHIMGRAVGFLPYLGWATIIMKDKPVVKNAAKSQTRRQIENHRCRSSFGSVSQIQ
ncbi:hypothetical protein RHGRI_024879 [Rhododendron griersonianum]|uniref:Signal peptidase I n=1 Tax=Rhododendron griersonianum TaxID=479676 RepID=A0AAV6JDX0_9ERIC|nr:hypothetical protein RHGRI_024879 [Rhododendron griersonianum]